MKNEINQKSQLAKKNNDLVRWRTDKQKKGEFMKTIIKIEKKTSIEVSPCKGGGVVLEVKTDYGNSTSSEVFRLTSAQAGSIISAIEFADNFGGQ